MKGLIVIFSLAAVSTCSGYLSVPIFPRINSRLCMSTENINVDAQQGRVTMYKKNGCPHCAKAIELLEGKYGLKINYVDIESENRDEILYQMQTFSGGRNTVPQIFFNAEHLGGNSDIQDIESKGVLSQKVSLVKCTPVSSMNEGWYHPWY